MKKTVATVLAISGTLAVAWRGAVSLYMAKNIDIPITMNITKNRNRTPISGGNQYTNKYASIIWGTWGVCVISHHR